MKHSDDSWKLNIFPNPTPNQITITSTEVLDNLSIEIRDLSNRIFLKETLQTKYFFTILDLHLCNGAYFITIKNSKNKSMNKKLLIAK